MKTLEDIFRIINAFRIFTEVLKGYLASFTSVLVNILTPFFGWLTVATLHLPLYLSQFVSYCRLEVIGNFLLMFFSKKNHPPKAAGEVYDKGKR